MKHFVLISLVCLAGCANSGFFADATPRPVARPAPGDAASGNAGDWETTGASEAVSAEPVAAILPPTRVAPPPPRPKLELPPAERPAPVPEGFGTTVASLGNVAEPGLWLKTPLVSSRQQGILKAANGSSVEVTLIPIDGPKTAGSRISIGALQELGLAITDLPELSVSPA